MKPCTFFGGRAVGFLALIALSLCFLLYKTYNKESQSGLVATTPEPNIEDIKGTPVFSWKYEADDSLNGDGLPQTNVYLEVSYSSLEKTSRLIATVPGSCNDLPDREKDSALNSSVAQCYAAGYGDLFKVIKGERSFMVMRKVFEEASPEYDPPVQPYKVVLEIPLSL
jgi:hypothetical protein